MRKKKSFLPLLLSLMACALIVSILYVNVFSSEKKIDSASLDGVDIVSPYGVLMDVKSGETLWEKNGEERLYPASLTKMMTAIVVLENLEDVSVPVVLSNEIFTAVYASHASVAGFVSGETASAKDLLYGMMLCSGGEAALGLADYIAGSEEAFVELMNEKAKDLELLDTHFANVTGLQDENHYTTAQDLGVILAYGLKNTTFREIFTTVSYQTESSDAHPEGILFTSTMFEEMGTAAFTGGVILGGKTGYTEAAGLCLASLAEVKGRELILITAGADGNHDSSPFHIEDALTIYGALGITEE